METTAKILIIDDEPGIREGCRKVLVPQGFSIEDASSFAEGKRMIQEGDYELVLLDIMLPDGRGVDLLEVIHKKDPDMIAVIITGYATVELAIEAIKQGAYDFISKPFDSGVLLITVNQGLEKRRLSLEAKRSQELEKEAAVLAQEKADVEKINEYKSNFLRVVAHELRSPLGGVQSLVRTLLRGLAGELNEKQLEILSRVDVRLDFFSLLINDLIILATSKEIYTETPLQNIEIQPILNKVIERYREEANTKHIDLKIQTPSKPVFILAFEDGLDKIFSNLIGNAIKYTPEQGEVSVILSKIDNKIHLQITDTGIGIPQEALQNIWEEFYRAPNAKHTQIPGTGLGLSIVKQYTDLLGGEVNVQSAEGKGCTFEVIFNISTKTD